MHQVNQFNFIIMFWSLNLEFQYFMSFTSSYFLVFFYIRYKLY